MQSQEERAVREFQQKVGAPAPMTLMDTKGTVGQALVSTELHDAAGDMMARSSMLKKLFRNTKDQRALRAELMLEELAELLLAMEVHDEVEALDAIGDILYVVYGTAVQFRLPAASAFWEAHTSNMSKGSQAATHSGDKGKGAGYKEPRFDLVLMAHRAQEEEETNQQKIDLGVSREHA